MLPPHQTAATTARIDAAVRHGYAKINGILDTASAVETLLETVLQQNPNAKIYETLTLRDIKKNGPKKGKPKVRVLPARGADEDG